MVGWLNMGTFSCAHRTLPRPLAFLSCAVGQGELGSQEPSLSHSGYCALCGEGSSTTTHRVLSWASVSIPPLAAICRGERQFTHSALLGSKCEGSHRAFVSDNPDFPPHFLFQTSRQSRASFVQLSRVCTVKEVLICAGYLSCP